MYTAYHIKETVKTLVITKQKQKINFQIKHPENVFAIIGVAVTCNKISDPVDPVLGHKGSMVGHISLAIPQKGDVIFSDDVQLDNNDYADLIEKNVWGLQLDISGAKKRDLYLRTLIKIDKAVLEGFYEDVYSPNLTTDTGEVYQYLYKIKIYIRYQVSQDHNIEKL